jgi:hypothetical protein
MARKLSEETRRKMSIAKAGKKRPPRSEEWCRKIGEGNKGKTIREETRIKVSLALKNKVVSEETRHKMSIAKKGKPSHRRGKTLPTEHKRKISESTKGKRVGEERHNWKGGASYEPYCPKFNKEFKERVREFFGRVCVECGTPERGKKLSVHHVNFNKMSCCDGTRPLFVPLCPSCHSKTNYNRDYWEEHFTEMLTNYFGGKCYLTTEERDSLHI